MHIRAWDMVTYAGIGKRAQVDPPVTAVEPDDEASPLSWARRLSAFSWQERLGKVGTRDFDRATGLLLVAAKGALENLDPSERLPSADRGVIVATAAGNLGSITSFTRETWDERLPYHVHPAHFPNTAINCCAGRTAIYLQMKGPNVTIAAGRLSFYSALRYAQRSLRLGHAESFLVGGIEEVSEQTAWAFYKLMQEGCIAHRYSEAAAMFYVSRSLAGEPEPSDAACEIIDVRVLRADQPVLRRSLYQALLSMLDEHHVTAQDIGLYCCRHRCLGGAAWPERLIFEFLESQTTCQMLDLEAHCGECHGAAGCMQLAYLLTEAEKRPQLIYSLASLHEEDGKYGLMLLRHDRRPLAAKTLLS